jgi:predicted kinase
MRKLFFTVGLVASGKSTWCEANKDKFNMVIHSSDAIREELSDINDQNNNQQVFDILHKRVKEDLLNDKNVCYDATNLNRKKRIAFLNQIKHIPCEKICVLFATPFDICKRNNANRDRKVPEYVLEKMIRNFEVPCRQEGWDDIQIVWWDYESEGIRFDIHKDVEKWRSVPHDNPHHKFSIGDHMLKAYEHAYINSYNNVYLPIICYMHDCGKVHTKKFEDGKGNTTSTAHFLEHHNVGSYFSLFYLKDLFKEDNMDICFSDEEILFMSLVVNLHMRPLLAWKQSSKAKEKDERLFGSKTICYIEFINKCDLAAH